MTWWKNNFFDAYLTDVIFSDEKWERAGREIDFILERSNIEKKASVLDLCCGTGRHSLALASRGYRVTGVDYSKSYLEKAKGKAREENLDIDFQKQNMSELNYDSKFDLTVNLFTSFGYFRDQEDNLRTLRQISRALKKNGMLVIDVINRGWMEKNFQSRDWRELENGDFLLEKRTFDPVEGRMKNEWIFLNNDNKKTYKFSHFIYSATQLKDMIESAGMKCCEVFGSLTGEDFERDSRRLVIFAENRQ